MLTIHSSWFNKPIKTKTIQKVIKEILQYKAVHIATNISCVELIKRNNLWQKKVPEFIGALLFSSSAGRDMPWMHNLRLECGQKSCGMYKSFPQFLEREGGRIRRRRGFLSNKLPRAPLILLSFVHWFLLRHPCRLFLFGGSCWEILLASLTLGWI